MKRSTVVMLSLFALTACHGGGSPESETAVIDLAVVIQGVDVQRLEYSVTGPGVQPAITGELGVRKDGTIAARIGGIPVGLDRLLTLKTSGTGTPECQGASRFDVQLGRATKVNVILQCVPRARGSASVETSVNTIPIIHSVLVAPDHVQPGGTVALAVSASDEDGDPLTYAWTASSGTFPDSSKGATAFTAPLAPGLVDVVINVHDDRGGSASQTVAIIVRAALECTTSAACDDGVACNGVERCVNGSCAAGEILSVDDGIACTIDVCAADGTITHTPNNAAADDGDPCTEDICDPTMGAVHTPIPGCGSFESQMLNAHNAVRAGVTPVPTPPILPLVWSAVLAAQAQAWANTCPTTHNPARGFTGENMARSSHAQTPAQVVDLWAAEAAHYDPVSHTCAPGAICGHYTQLVWRDTTAVGCGFRGDCPGTGGPLNLGFVYICNYSPPGNFNSQTPF